MTNFSNFFLKMNSYALAFIRMARQNSVFLCWLVAGFGLQGCAGLLGGQAPAPVYRVGSTVYSVPAAVPPPAPAPAAPSAQAPQPQEVVQTQPLQTSSEPSIAPLEPLPEPTPLQPSAAVPPTNVSNISAASPLTSEDQATQANQPNQTGQTNPAEQAGALPSELAPPPEQPPPEPMVFAPLQNFAPMSPAVGALVLAANKDSQKGSYDTATTTLERAIRIEPRNAALYYKLAVIKLDQSKPSLAEDLAKKALSIVGKDNQLKKHCWLLIAKARDQQNNEAGAKAALDKAEKL